MSKPIGPTIPRWQLGEQLSRLRELAGISQTQAAQTLGCSLSKVQKIEAGDVGVVKGELMFMFDIYKLADDTARAELLELQRLGKQRGWWSKFGQMPTPLATYLGLESAATSIRTFQPLIIPGLCQTADYARAIIEATFQPGAADVERQVQLRMDRQKQILDDTPPMIWVILDEAALRRQIGGAAVMAAQLVHLHQMSKQMTILVVPFAHGGYPGTLGAMTIFEFDEDRHSPVVHVEGQAGNLYLERDADLHRCNLDYNEITAAALSKGESAKLIAAIARE